MSKKLTSLVDDIYSVIENVGGWDKAITKYFSEELSKVAEARFSERQERNYLSLSSVGTPCQRKLWYRINQPDKAEPLDAEALGTFFYGDMIETLLLSLAKAAGHSVEGEQDEVEVFGVKGHRDAIIDGVTVDVKSASRYGFQKFQKHDLRNDDPFGYISQLSSYVYAGRDDPLVSDKSGGAFLVANKERFKLCLDYYDLTPELETKEQEIKQVQKATGSVSSSNKKLDKRAHPDIPRLSPEPQHKGKDAKGKPKDNGNRVVSLPCNYCEWKKYCWGDDVRKFKYSTGVIYFTKVVKEPNVTEIID